MQKGMRDGVPAPDLRNNGDIGVDASGLDWEMHSELVAASHASVAADGLRSLVVRDGASHIPDATTDYDQSAQADGGTNEIDIQD